METALINGVQTFGFDSFDEIMTYAIETPCILVAINAEKIYYANDLTRLIINQNIGYPDGIGAVWALRKKGINQKKRIPGCDLWLEIIKRYHHDKSFYLIGSEKQVIEETVCRLKSMFDGINILSYRDGYIQDNEKEIVINDIMNKKPDIVFVAQGSPRQELFMMESFKKHPALYQGLGGSFDLFVGKVKPTPRLVQNLGFHWLYRAIQEPKRFKRHRGLMMFLWNLFVKKIY